MRIMALSLQEKIEDTKQGVYLIGTTPPKVGTDKAQLKTIAEKLLGRLHEIEYDGVIIYDIQDESSRTNQARPFPFKQTVDPREYSQLLRNLSAQDVITYKSVAQRGVGEFKDWLSETKNDYDLKNVFSASSMRHLVASGTEIPNHCINSKVFSPPQGVNVKISRFGVMPCALQVRA